MHARGRRRSSAHGIVHRVEHRQAEMRWCRPRPGVTPPTICVPIGDALLGVERALLAGEALADDLGVLVDENAHGRILIGFQRLPATTFWPRRRGRSAGIDRQADCREHLACACSALVPSRRTTTGTCTLDLASPPAIDALGDHVAAHDAAEDVDEDAFARSDSRGSS
jgi:hypothetical protein